MPVAAEIAPKAVESSLSASSAAQAITPAANRSVSASPAAADRAWEGWMWWVGIAFAPILIVGGVLHQVGQAQKLPNQKLSSQKSPEKYPAPEENLVPEAETPVNASSERSETGGQQEFAAARLSKVDRVEALIAGLHRSDFGQRRKAIWELGQRGDSRAMQPLVDLLIDSDSQQRSLILAALSEISIRTLKPMN